MEATAAQPADRTFSVVSREGVVEHTWDTDEASARRFAFRSVGLWDVLVDGAGRVVAHRDEIDSFFRPSRRA